MGAVVAGKRSPVCDADGEAGDKLRQYKSSRWDHRCTAAITRDVAARTLDVSHVHITALYRRDSRHASVAALLLAVVCTRSAWTSHLPGSAIVRHPTVRAPSVCSPRSIPIQSAGTSVRDVVLHNIKSQVYNPLSSTIVRHLILSQYAVQFTTAAPDAF